MTRAYLRARAGALLLIGAFILVFIAVLALYALPLEPIAYALAICAALGACALALDFYAFQKRRRALRALLKSVTLSLDGLPEASGAIEADYQALLRDLSGALKRAEQKSESAGRAMLDYYTLWVHQIKTPIAAMRLLLDPREHPDAKAAAAELFKIEEYVSMALCYMRLQSDTTDLVIKSYPLEPIVKRAARKYARLFIQKKIRLDVANVALDVLTDEKWLSFAVEQVLSNAVKYTREGGVSVYVRGRSLIVEDTGIGIEPADLPRVFERGYTGVGGRTDRHSTGIGLYLTRRILTMLGHTIRIESEAGAGTRVVIGLNREAVEWE